MEEVVEDLLIPGMLAVIVAGIAFIAARKPFF
jgi:hypothetical protein